MKTIKERIEAKAEIIARKRANDIEHIRVFLNDEEGEPDYGELHIEFKKWGKPYKDANGNFRDHDDYWAIEDMKAFLKPLGLTLEIISNGDGSDTFKVIFV